MAKENPQPDAIRAEMRENSPFCERERGRNRQCAIVSSKREGRGKSLSDAKLLIEVSGIKARLEKVESQLSAEACIVPIQSLFPAEINVRKPILAAVYLDEGFHVASMADANINASGESVLEAVEMLKEQIAWAFTYYCENEESLGDEPKRQLSILREFLASA